MIVLLNKLVEISEKKHCCVIVSILYTVFPVSKVLHGHGPEPVNDTESSKKKNATERNNL